MPKRAKEQEPPPIGKWLATVRFINGLDQDALAGYIHKSRKSVSAYELGTRKVPSEVVDAVLRSFENAPRPPADPYGDDDQAGADDPGRVALPYYGVVPSLMAEAAEMRIVDSKFAGEGRFVRKVGGKSAMPALEDGDYTIWQEDLDPPLGVIVIAQDPQGKASAIKKMVFDEDLRRVIARPVNPNYQAPEAEMEWEPVARLIYVMRDRVAPERTWRWEAGLRPEHLESLAPAHHEPGRDPRGA